MKTLKQEEIRCFEYRDIEDLRTHLTVFFDRYDNATRRTRRWVTGRQKSLKGGRRKQRQRKSRRLPA